MSCRDTDAVATEPAERPAAGLRGLTKLLGSSVLGKVVAAVGSPLLVLLYDAAAFGAFATVAAATSVLNIVLAGRYEQAIPVAATDAEARGLLHLTRRLVVLSAGIVAIFAFVARTPLEGVSPLGRVPLWWAWLPLGLLLSGWATAQSAWATRTSSTDRLSRFQLGQGVGSVGLQALCGLAGG